MAKHGCALRALGLLLADGTPTGHPAPDRAALRSSILNEAFFGTMTQLRGTPLTQRHLFWLEEFFFLRGTQFSGASELKEGLVSKCKFI